MARPRLDPELKQKIKSLTLAGNGQKEIAALLKVHRNRVYRFQRSLGLHARRVLPLEVEQEILGLLKSGMGTSKIGKRLGVGEHQARKVAAKYHFRRRPGESGYRYHLSQRNRKRITEDILRRTDHAAPLARKHGISYRVMLRIVKETLGCERLTPGNPKQALESPFAQKWPEMFAAAQEPITPGEDSAAVFVKLVDAVLKKCFYGKFPFDAEYDADFAAALLYCFHHRVPGFEAQPQPVLDNFAGGLVEAINVLRESRAAQFLN
jgi:DNA-binding CsgD family transcriptional regulator